MSEAETFPETNQKYFCPCFRPFTARGDIVTGFCSEQKLLRQDGYSSLSCDFNGDAEICKKKHPDPNVREALEGELVEQSVRLAHKGDYFAHILRKS